MRDSPGVGSPAQVLSAVAPDLSRASRMAPASSSTVTTSTMPACAAQWSAVRPCWLSVVDLFTFAFSTWGPNAGLVSGEDRRVEQACESRVWGGPSIRDW